MGLVFYELLMLLDLTHADDERVNAERLANEHDTRLELLCELPTVR